MLSSNNTYSPLAEISSAPLMHSLDLPVDSAGKHPMSTLLHGSGEGSSIGTGDIGFHPRPLARHRSNTRYVINQEIARAKKAFVEFYDEIERSETDDLAVERIKPLLKPLQDDPSFARQVRKSRVHEEIDTFTKKEFPIHLACKYAFPKILESLLSLPGWSDLSDEPDMDGKTPLFHLFAPDNIHSSGENNLKTRQAMLIKLFTLGVSIKREDKNNKNVFDYLKESRLWGSCTLIIKALAGRIVTGGQASLREQSRKHVIEHIENTALNLESRVDDKGIWKAFGDYCQIYYDTKAKSKTPMLKRSWDPWHICIRLHGKKVNQQIMRKRISKRFSSANMLRSSSNSMSRSSAILQNFNFENPLGEIEGAKKRHGIWAVTEMAVSLDFIDSNDISLVSRTSLRGAERVSISSYIYKIFEREENSSIEIIEKEIDAFFEDNLMLSFTKLELVNNYWQAYMAMAFHFHEYLFENFGHALKRKIGSHHHENFIMHSLRIFFLLEHLEYISSLSEEEILAKEQGHTISTYVHNCLVEDGSFDITLVENILENYIPGMTPTVERELQGIRKQAEKFDLKTLDNLFHINILSNSVVKYAKKNDIAKANETLEILLKTDVSLFPRFQRFVVKRFIQGPHQIRIRNKTRDDKNDLKSVLNKVRGGWESNHVLCPIDSRSSKRLEQKNQLADTATYFLVEVISAALNANCGKCVCECIDTKHTSRHNLLEILRYCPVVRTAGTVLEPAVAKIYEKLLVAAAQFPDEAKSMSLVEILLEKKVSIHEIENRNIFPLDLALRKEMVALGTILIHGGARVKLETLETLFRSYQSRVFYLKKNFDSDERQDTLSKEQAQLNSLLKTILLCGASSGTLSSDVLSYLSRKTSALKDDGIRYDINMTDDSGGTAMHYAAMYGNANVIKLLYHYGAEDSLAMVDHYKDHRTIVSKHDNFRGYTPLGLAVQNRHYDATAALLNLGADPFDGLPAMYNSNPACPYWLALDVPLRVEGFGLVKWQDDHSTLTCKVCEKKFTFILRRHHCRFCGKIVCNNCSSAKIHGLRACKVCIKEKENSSDSRHFLLKAKQARQNRSKFCKVQSQSSYRKPIIPSVQSHQHNFMSDGILNLLEVVDLKRRQEMHVLSIRDIFSAINRQKEKRTSLKVKGSSMRWGLVKKNVTTSVGGMSFRVIAMRMLEKVLEEGDEAFRWHRQYSERRRRQSHVVMAWMLKCKLYETRQQTYAIARRMPSRDSVHQPKTWKNFCLPLSVCLGCPRQEEDPWAGIKRRAVRRRSININSLNSTSSNMQAVDAETFKKDRQKKQDQINLFMQKQKVVQAMRKEYGRIDFYIEISTIFISFFMGFYFFHVSLNSYRGENHMSEFITSSIIENSSGESLYNQISSNDVRPFYVWLKQGLLKDSLPRIRKKYFQVGKVRIIQERLTTLNGFGVTGPRYTNTPFGAPNCAWGLKKASNNASETGKDESYAFKCNAYSNIDRKPIYIHGLSLFDVKKQEYFVDNLRNASFIDEKTRLLQVDALFFSNNLDIYTQASIRFEYSPSGVMHSSIVYSIFHPMDFYNRRMDEKSGYYIAFTLFFLSTVIELASIFRRFVLRIKSIQQFIADNKLVSYIDTSSSRKKQKKISSLSIIWNNYARVGKTIWVKRSAKFWYNIVSALLLFYFFASLEPYGHYFESKFANIDSNNKIITLSDGSKNLYSDVNVFVARIDTATWICIAYVLVFGVCFLNEMQRHPDFGNLVLGVKKTFFSNDVLSFFLMAIFCLFCFVLMFRLLLGDSRMAWFSMSGMLPLFTFFMSGEHDSDFFYVDERSWSSFVYLIFLVGVVLFFMNLFIAVLNSVWENNIATSLWDNEIDKRIRAHIKANMSDTDANDSIVIAYLYDIVYGVAHRKKYESRLDSRKKVCFEICFLVYVILFAVSIILILTRQLWFIFAFQSGGQAILFLLFILLFTIIIFVSKLQKKQKRRKLGEPGWG